MKMRRSWWSNK